MGGSHPLFQPPAKNALLFFVWLWYIGLEIVKAALKSSIFLFFLEQLCYFNLSPQGDGNVAMNPLGWTKLRFQLIPVRGRKHKEDDSGFYFAELFQLIPARGRKPESPRYLSGNNLFQLIPARGRKQDRLDAVLVALDISTYPRKGTET